MPKIGLVTIKNIGMMEFDLIPLVQWQVVSPEQQVLELLDLFLV